MKSLKYLLEEWHKQQLITQQQVNAILHYENSKPVGRWIFLSFLILGLSVIIIGTIAIVAANWHKIPDSIKLLGDFLLLLSLGYGIGVANHLQKIRYFESLLFLFMALCLASIGLISQIYQLQGNFCDAVFFWVLITLPVVLLSQQKTLPYIWTIAFLASLSYQLATAHFSPLYSFPETQWQAVVIALPLFCAVVTRCIQPYARLANFATAFRHGVFFTGIFALVLGDTVLSESVCKHFTVDGWQPLYPAMLMALLLLLSILRDRQKTALGKLLLIGVVGFYIVLFDLAYSSLHSPLLAAVITITILMLLAGYWGIKRERSLFNFTIILIGLRFFWLYYRAFNGLLMTGLGLILSGLIIIIMVYLWHKNREKLQRWLEGLNA